MNKNIVIALSTLSFFALVAIVILLILLLTRKKKNTDANQIKFYSEPNQTGDEYVVTGDPEGELLD